MSACADTIRDPRSDIRPGSADVLAIGFGTAVVMWCVGYLTHIPMIVLPGAVVFALLAGVKVGSGFVVGRYTRRGPVGAAGIALLTMLINLLVLGSLLGEGGEGPAAWLWLPGYAAVSIGLMLAGQAIGRMKPAQRQPNWPMGFALSAVGATALVVVAGGLVTGFDAGFSVPDWPTTFEMNMFVYPLSKMTGGIYYEHTHRLVGALVGLTTLVLAAWLWRADRRWRVRLLGAALFVGVCVQGVLGGLWVTAVDPAAAATMAADEVVQRADGSFIAAPTLAYVLIHGTMGQIILAGLAVLAATQSRTWRDCSIVQTDAAASTDRVAGVLAAAVLVVQLAIGVYLRKQGAGLLLHITMAVVVTVLVMAAGVRAWAVRGERFAVLRKLGIAVLVLLVAQLTLGVAALIARDANHTAVVTVGSDATGSPIDAVITTLHQSTGAALLAMVAALAAWMTRLLKTPLMPPATDPTLGDRQRTTAASAQADERRAPATVG